MKYSADATVAKSEVERRLRDYRKKGLEHRALPHIIYRPPFVACPWTDCSYSIAGIDFQLELMGDQTLYERLMDAWWVGDGLVGRCPGCRKHVLYTMKDKQRVDDTSQYRSNLLPDDWHEHAFFLSQ